jgi:hypothetical protein
MSISESIPLKSLTDQTDYVNNSDTIRKLKHSGRIYEDVFKLHTFKTKYSSLWSSDPQQFLDMATSECAFLYNNYMDLFHKMIKDELDLTIMRRLLIALKLIEDGAVDQHDGSVMVGKILKELYIDSAVKRGDNLDIEHQQERPTLVEGQAISWKQYKNMNV